LLIIIDLHHLLFFILILFIYYISEKSIRISQIKKIIFLIMIPVLNEDFILELLILLKIHLEFPHFKNILKSKQSINFWNNSFIFIKIWRLRIFNAITIKNRFNISAVKLRSMFLKYSFQLIFYTYFIFNLLFLVLLYLLAHQSLYFQLFFIQLF
jgi:hypothetical protein